uniref:Cytosolic fatty-acid binding proteins domain-containing protein n=1 Tax=Meloidogyne incognita TaxID=6306 RepID=A0A914KIX9_MELIC
MADKFVGKWKLCDSTNFDEYLKQVGVGLLTRTAAKAIKPELEFVVDGDKWKMTSTSAFTTWVCEFLLGEEKEQATADGRKLKCTFTFVDGKLIEEQKKINDDDKESHFERYIDADGKLVITCKSGNVEAVRKYEKI